MIRNTSKTLSTVCYNTWAGLFNAWVKITQARKVSAKFDFRRESFILSSGCWSDALKNNKKITQRNVFEQKKKRPKR